jgi:hypothetical protein
MVDPLNVCGRILEIVPESVPGAPKTEPSAPRLWRMTMWSAPMDWSSSILMDYHGSVVVRFAAVAPKYLSHRAAVAVQITIARVDEHSQHAPCSLHARLRNSHFDPCMWRLSPAKKALL